LHEESFSMNCPQPDHEPLRFDLFHSLRGHASCRSGLKCHVSGQKLFHNRFRPNMAGSSLQVITTQFPILSAGTTTTLGCSEGDYFLELTSRRIPFFISLRERCNLAESSGKQTTLEPEGYLSGTEGTLTDKNAMHSKSEHISEA
jgi:hypothetical protein